MPCGHRRLKPPHRSALYTAQATLVALLAMLGTAVLNLGVVVRGTFAHACHSHPNASPGEFGPDNLSWNMVINELER